MRHQFAEGVSKSSNSYFRGAAIFGIVLVASICGVIIPLLIPVSANEALVIAAGFGVITLGVVCVVFDLPIDMILRFSFVFSFFFKRDLNLYKIDEIEDPSGFNISLTLVLAIALIAYDAFFGNDSCNVRVFPKSFAICISLLLLWTTFGVIYGGSNMIGWFSVWSFITLIILSYSIASHFSQRGRLIELGYYLAIGLVFTGLVSMSQYFADFPTNMAFFGTGTEEELLGTQSRILSRVQSFLRTPTEMAWVLSSLLPIVAALVVCRVKGFDSKQKLLFIAASLLGVIAIILSLARGSWISLVIGLAGLFAFGWYRLSKDETRSYLVSVIGVVALSCLLLLPLTGRIVDRLSGEDDGSAMIRIPLMETAIRVISDNPYVGVGMNSYRENSRKYDETSVFVSTIFPNPVHNVFAHVTAEVGIPGGLLFCFLFVFAIYECWKATSNYDRLIFAIGLGVFCGLIGFIISAMKEPSSLGSTRPPMRTLFLMFGIILAVSRIRRQTTVY